MATEVATDQSSVRGHSSQNDRFLFKLSLDSLASAGSNQPISDHQNHRSIIL